MDATEELPLLWARWASRADAVDDNSIHSLDPDSLRHVLARLPCKERYLAVCKLIRLELLRLVASAQRLRGPRLHRSHARPGRLAALRAALRNRSQLAPLPLCVNLRSLRDDASGVRGEGWQSVLTRPAAQSSIASLSVSLAPWDETAAARAVALLPACTRLTSLSLRADSPNIGATLNALLPALPQLRSFTLQYWGQGSFSLDVLSTLPALDTLAVFNLHLAEFRMGVFAPELDGDCIWRAARCCPHLTSLAISACWPQDRRPRPTHPPSAPLATIAIGEPCSTLRAHAFASSCLIDDLLQLPTLKALRIHLQDGSHLLVHEPYPIAAGNFASFFVRLAAAPSWPRLHTLSLDASFETLRHAHELPLPHDCRALTIRANMLFELSFLNQCPLLTRLELDAGLSLSSLNWLASWLNAGQGLESLSLVCGRDADGFAALTPAISSLAALTHLELDVTSEADCRALASALPPRLAALGVLGLSAAAAPPLLDAVAALPGLTRLNASRCELDALRAVARALPRCAALRSLTLRRVGPDVGLQRAACVTVYRGGPSPWGALAGALPRCSALESLHVDDVCALPRGMSQQTEAWLASGDLFFVNASLERALPACRVLREVVLKGGNPFGRGISEDDPFHLLWWQYVSMVGAVCVAVAAAGWWFQLLGAATCVLVAVLTIAAVPGVVPDAYAPLLVVIDVAA